MTVTTVMGSGTQKGASTDVDNEIRGFKININLLPKIQAFYQSEEGQRLFEEWINRRNAEEKTGKCKGS